MVHNIGNKMNERFGLSNDKNEENTDSIKVVCKRDTVSDRIKADFKFKKRMKVVAIAVLFSASLIPIYNIAENLFGDVYFVDLYNNVTNEWMNIDLSGFNINDFQKFIENGDYSVAYTNDADFIGMSSEQLANAGVITGFINTADYIDMIYKSLDYRKNFTV